ncbi:LysR family transcriptional regulator [Hoeflea sp. YIM 152468]|uniref:LysR family transcriptional regulator n=1 Tax=Hoeflea sp. YIM 152468 TaxID=3031759 RepID=UPI0023DB4A9A|nr:LysR family transcriptional regulator [Hoeflea sp. YIM 152468]MDF1610246.1 LysR family transcriptional regulator [Hoeflea sp. YIM 152468]
MNKFNAIQIFVRVTEHGGFTAAAKRLGISVSAVTKAVSRLENELGAQLFARTTRQIRITDYGQEFYERCVQILAELEDAETALRHGATASRGRVRVVLPFSFGRVTVIPELPRFIERYPLIELEIDFSDAAVDMISEGYDIAVRTGEISDTRLNTRVLTRGPQVTVGTPEYFEQFGKPETPEDLVNHRCIIGRFGSEWSFRRPNGGRYAVRVPRNYVFNSGDALREAAVAGLGITQGTWWLLRKDLESGAIVSVLDDYADQGMPVSILYTANLYVPRKVRAFLDFLIEITKTD